MVYKAAAPDYYGRMVTQRDIADRVGVSVSLVSRVLSGAATRIGVSEQTIRRVQAAAAEMGYLPNASACILKGAPARTIGVVIYDFEDPFFGPMIGTLQRMAHPQQYSLVLGGFERRHIWELDVAALLKHHIDGLIIMGSGDLDWAEPFLDKKLPVARIGGGPRREGVHRVEVDESAGMTLLVAHLRAQGARRIGFAGGDHAAHRLRADVFHTVMQQTKGAVEREDIVFSREHLADAGYAVGRQWTAPGAPTPPDAVIAASDLVAMGLLRAFAEADVGVPDRVAVTGYDDLPSARFTIPSLTTVRQPVEAMAKAAFEWVIDDHRAAPERVVFAPELVVRESSIFNREGHRG